MTSRPFLIWPDIRLRQRAGPVGRVDDGVHALWDEMIAAMIAMPGVGLAAPQLGIPLRLAVVDCSPGRDRPVRLADPVVIASSAARQRNREASPNLPGIAAEVERPERVTVTFLDESGARAEREFAGLWAASVQHQIDHLDGLVFLDRLKPARRQLLLSRYMRTRRA